MKYSWASRLGEMITCHPTQQKSTAPEVPAPDASGFCAFHLNPTSTKWHCVTLSIVPGAWLRKGLRPPGEDFCWPTGAAWNPTNGWKIIKYWSFDMYYFLLLLVGSGITLAVVVVLRRKIQRNTTMRKPKKWYFLTAFKPFDLPSFLESFFKKKTTK